jgi:hypothetical protein
MPCALLLAAAFKTFRFLSDFDTYISSSSFSKNRNKSDVWAVFCRKMENQSIHEVCASWTIKELDEKFMFVCERCFAANRKYSTHQNYELGYFQQKKTGGRPHGVSLPWVPKSLILSSYGRKFGAGSLGTKSNIAKTSCGFVRLDLKFEKPKAERECLLLSCLVLWELSKDRFFRPHGRQEAGRSTINSSFDHESCILITYTHLWGNQNANEQEVMRFSPLFEEDANQNSRTLSPESPEKNRTGDIMRIGADRSLSNGVQKQIHYGKIRSSAEMCETKSTSRTYYGVRMVEGSYKTNTRTTANECYQKH